MHLSVEETKNILTFGRLLLCFKKLPHGTFVEVDELNDLDVKRQQNLYGIKCFIKCLLLLLFPGCWWFTTP